MLLAVAHVFVSLDIVRKALLASPLLVVSARAIGIYLDRMWFLVCLLIVIPLLSVDHKIERLFLFARWSFGLTAALSRYKLLFACSHRVTALRASMNSSLRGIHCSQSHGLSHMCTDL